MKKINQFLEHVYSKFIIYTPSIALAILGTQLLIVFWLDPVSVQLNERIVTAIKMASTLAALSFYAGYMTTKSHKKPKFYLNGERFFNVAVMLFSINLLQKLLISQVVFISNDLALSTSQILINCIVSIFMVYSITLMCTGLYSLLKVLHLEVKQKIHN
ncbi:MAG: hypothetical protein KAI44_04545 [Methylococcales bacterium]|nr:hypothetical protein [Methylococcales bacterium]